MATPTDITNLSTTAASNSPAGSEPPSVLDNEIRALASIIKQNVSQGADIASAGTLALPAAGGFFDITGTTTVTGISSTNSWNGRVVYLQFDGALTLTHSANLDLPGDANITTVAGDSGIFVQKASGTWQCLSFTQATGAYITASSTDTLTNKTIVAANNTLTIASTDLSDTADLTYNADTDVSSNGWVVDEDNMASDLATKVPTQQSVKAYVDTQVATAAIDGPSFSAYRGTSDQSVSTASYVKVQFNAEDFDSDGVFDPTTNYRFTPDVAGYYQINASVYFQASSGLTENYVAIYKNGSIVTSSGSDMSGTLCITDVSAIVELNGSTDYVEIYVYVTAGTSPVIKSTDGRTKFSGALVRSA